MRRYSVGTRVAIAPPCARSSMPARRRQDLWLGSDEGATLERLSPTKRRTYGHHRSCELADFIDLPDAKEAVDIEGLAYATGHRPKRSWADAPCRPTARRTAAQRVDGRAPRRRSSRSVSPDDDARLQLVVVYDAPLTHRSRGRTGVDADVYDVG